MSKKQERLQTLYDTLQLYDVEWNKLGFMSEKDQVLFDALYELISIINGMGKGG